jgi:homoserine dehydrogenase
MMTMHVAILGYGTVGSGVAEVIERNGDLISRRFSDPIRIKYILDVRDFPDSPHRGLFIKDFSLIENDPEVSVVAETIGGTKIAYEFTRRALCAGKSVVTSNKELVAEHGCELIELACKHGVSYLFEGSVGGGIPILRPISQCLAANDISEICGILNGTTNYILTKMIREGLSFQAALAEAQQNGYAERDPAADLEGHDACRKICILASLAFGRHVYPSSVPTEGITGVSLADADYAAGAGYKIKLLGRAIRDDSGRVRAYVAPHLVAYGSPLANVEDVFNAIVVRGDAVGDVMFYGRGAGKLPTASAVVADMIDAIRHKDEKKQPAWGPGSEDMTVSPDDLAFRWYVRILGGVEKVCFEKAEILGRGGAPANETAFLTGPMSKAELLKRTAGLKVHSAIRVLS